MKKIFFILVFAFISIFSLFAENTFAECVYNGEITSNLEACVSGTDLYKVSDATVDEWFKNILLKWIKNIAVYLWVIAVFAIVLASAMMTISTWDDEKINKAKNILKWAIFWLLWVMFASTIITLIINIIYRLWEV